VRPRDYLISSLMKQLALARDVLRRWLKVARRSANMVSLSEATRPGPVGFPLRVTGVIEVTSGCSPMLNYLLPAFSEVCAHSPRLLGARQQIVPWSVHQQATALILICDCGR